MNTGLLEHILTFVRAVETGSFTAVAHEQGQSQPTVSRQISTLEEHLGVRLMQRTTRALTLTEEGQTYYLHARALLDSAEEAAGSVRPNAEIRGTLRIAAPLAFTRLHLMPRLGQFLDENPGVRTDWVVGDRPIDLVGEGVDIAVRIGRVTDQGVIVRRIGRTRRVTVARPSYFADRGRPTHPAELSGHDCIVYSGLSTTDEWHFTGPENEPIVVKVSGRVRVNASEAMRAAVIEGLGVAVCPTWLFTTELVDGTLEEVLTTFEPASLPIQVLYPSRRLVPPRVRAFAEYLQQSFRSDPKLSDGRGGV